MSSRCRKIFGSPGTGKTTRLIQLYNELVEGGMLPTDILILTFTRSARREFRSRVTGRASHNNIRTIHSFCYQHQQADKRRFCGGRFLRTFFLDAGVCPNTGLENDYFRDLQGLLSLAKSAEPGGTREEFLISKAAHMGISRDQVLGLSEAYARYLKKNSLWDWVHILKEFIASDFTNPYKAVIVDEAQDLSGLQWDVVEKLQKDVDELILAGDDDQSIYGFSGAEVERFINFPGEVEVLPVTWRLSQEVLDFSLSLTEKIRYRAHKDIRVSGKRTGGVHLLCGPDEVAQTMLEKKGQSFLFLSRNQSFLRYYARALVEEGIHFTVENPRGNLDWLEIEDPYNSNVLKYIRMCDKLTKGGVIRGSKWNELSKGRHKNYSPLPKDARVDVFYLVRNKIQKPGEEWTEYSRLRPEDRELIWAEMCKDNGYDVASYPKIRLSTIHASKGLEADNVVLASGLLDKSLKAWNEVDDDELRVLYVGVTRTLGDLYLVAAPGHSKRGYNFVELLKNFRKEK